MLSEHAQAYRSILRELRMSVVAPRKVNKTIATSFRSMIEAPRESNNVVVLRDIENAVNFIRSQRDHKALLERYNPLIDLTGEERIKKTARRVGLDMPISHQPS